MPSYEMVLRTKLGLAVLHHGIGEDVPMTSPCAKRRVMYMACHIIIVHKILDSDPVTFVHVV